MSARAIGDIVGQVVAEAIGLGRLQEMLDTFPPGLARRQWIMEWWLGGTITGDEAVLLIQHNEREDA